MTTDNDSVRAEFEESFPVPEDCEWNDVNGAYCWKNMTAYHPQDNLWEAWQASRERYVPSIEKVETNNLHLRELVRHLRVCAECAEFDVSDCETGRQLWMAAMVQATPNGGNES